MESRSSFKGLFFMMGIVVVIYSSVSVFFLIFGSSVLGSSPQILVSSYKKIKNKSPLSKTQKTQIPLLLGLPLRLTIPSIHVDSSINYVGLTPEGKMDIFKGPIGVSWYDLGPRPGEIGSAVIAGHYGIWKNGDVSVFQRLRNLHTGDIVSVENDKGETISFVVRQSKIYAMNANTLEVFSSGDGMSHLNLITCVFDPISRTYPNRLVVFTDKIIE